MENLLSFVSIIFSYVTEGGKVERLEGRMGAGEFFVGLLDSVSPLLLCG